MLLIYTQKLTPRITYVFRHICTRILGLEITFTSAIDEFVAHSGAKLSYGKHPLGTEAFIQSEGLLMQQGFEAFDITVREWDETKCFFAVSDKSLLPFDIFSASFFLLSRYEEYLPHVKDAMGRFPASESLAFREGFLHQPVVDIWAYKFKAVLENSFPELSFPSKKMKIHNLVDASKPYIYTQQGFLRTLSGYWSDLWALKLRYVAARSKVIFGRRKDPFDTFKWIVNRVKKSDTQLSIFFLLGEALEFKESMNSQRRKFKMLVKFVSDYQEVGLIFSYNSLKDYEKLKKEKKRIEDITNRTLRSSMNSQFLVNLPDIYRDLVELEIVKDFTMVFENEVGFRAGTCTPFLFYDLDSEIKTPLIIHPIAISTVALKKKHDSEINKIFNAVMQEVAKVNGTFSMLFTNKDFNGLEKNKIWRSIFSERLQRYE
jgi:hypothetical protein